MKTLPGLIVFVCLLNSALSSNNLPKNFSEEVGFFLFQHEPYVYHPQKESLFLMRNTLKAMTKANSDEAHGEVRIWAVIVGAAQYTYMPTLRYTDDDAYLFYAFLKSPEGGALPDRQIQLLIDEDASKANIQHAIKRVFYQADENDVILFYFSGHGVQGAFLPIDFDGIGNKLTHLELKQMVGQSKAKHKLIVADACHSGGLISISDSRKIDLSGYYSAFEEASGGTALLMSSKSAEYSWEDEGLRSGVFSHFFIKGLKGAADFDESQIVTISEIFNYVQFQVKDATENAQNPIITGDFNLNMPVSYVRY